MSAGPVAPGPRLVYDADSASAQQAPQPARPARVRPWLWVALFAAVALFGVFQWRRVVGLEARVQQLSAALATAQAENTARRRQLDAIRTSVDDVLSRVTGLASLAAQEPTAPSAPPAEAAPAH